MGSISVSSDFKGFCSNLRMSEYTVASIQKRYHAITQRINLDFWNSSSEVTHSLYVGSYGRGTCIYTSDIDIIVELPWAEYTRYDNYSGNGQSALLAAVRNCLLKTYSSSNISADGQVVDITFSDGVKFEVVPAFRFSDDDGYIYPDTNNGGSWKSMNPKLEMRCFNGRNSLCNGNLKRLCRMLRAWKSKHTVLMSGILLDTTAYRFMLNYEYADKSFEYYDWMSRDYFKYLLDHADQVYWNKPGDTGRVKREYSIRSDAQFAYDKALEAIEDYSKDYSYCWHQDWREIYGTKFPNS